MFSFNNFSVICSDIFTNIKTYGVLMRCQEVFPDE